MDVGAVAAIKPRDLPAAAYRHLASPADELRDAAPKLLLRRRLLHLPAAMNKITMTTRTQNPTNTMPAPGPNPFTRVGR
jgi:hypothetical protein